MKTMMMAALLVAMGVGMAGCETFKGVGRDITGTAETVQGWFH